MKSTVERYGQVAVVIHWVSAALVLILIVTGFLSGFSDDVATKAQALRVHVPVAVLVLLVTLWRLIWWWKYDRKPAPVDSVSAWQDAAARWTHRGLYLLLFVLLGSGIAMSILSGLPGALFGPAEIPELSDLSPRAAHGLAARMIAALVCLHAGAALYHHLVLKDRTLRRMLPGG